MGSLSFTGVAQGTVISPNQTLPLDNAESSGVFRQTAPRIGTAVGIAVITAAASGTLGVSSSGMAMSVGFGLIALMVVLALLVALKDLRDRGHWSATNDGKP